MTAPEAKENAGPLGTRGLVILSLVAATAIAYAFLDVSFLDLWPSESGRKVAADFFGRALSPAFESERSFVPPGTPPLWRIALRAAWTTFLFAAASMGLALIFGLVFGFLASSAWWRGESPGADAAWKRWLRRTIAPTIYAVSRGFIATVRSIHEILWATVFLTAFGLCDAAALLALALPYGGYLAKIFSEMIDETPEEGAAGLQALGAGPLQVFSFGLLTRAIPDMISYAFYRFECALRSSAVLGFFGFPTLGLFIRQSFKATNYGEVWTYLYALIATIIIFDWWSGAVRKRLIA